MKRNQDWAVGQEVAGPQVGAELQSTSPTVKKVSSFHS